ncbi:protein kinase domain-containing protein [Actinomadura parmotrematis]|uniref:Protein kinase n=1 Tax=Actinomadura parmotrematis TaxID=2864039 RepID=A0ABS7FYF9_9ACTN|nr:DnaJ C-terminal domain-containing protein [Actinomadura parmotrematis]MBW8484478.1 protein kinase [Actinomadura parmotrematis]
MPERAGEYELLRRIGAGAMGEVHLALAPTGRTVAVKLLHRHMLDDRSIRARFAREVEVMSAVRHEGVAAILGFDLDTEPPYLVTRYAQGRSLQRTVAESGPLRGAALDVLLRGSAAALAAIHAAGIVHRDVKPDNIVLDDGRPMIIDFGIAHTLGATRITRLGGARAGSVRYMAPELWRGEQPTPAVDVFAWAASMVWAASGRNAFEAGSDEAIMYRIFSGLPDLDGVPDGLRGLLAKALASDPRDRPPAAELPGRLRQLEGAATVPEPRVPRPPLPVEVSLGEVFAGAEREVEAGGRTVRFSVPHEALTGRIAEVGEGVRVVFEVVAEPGHERRGDDLYLPLVLDEETAARGGRRSVDLPDRSRVSLPLSPSVKDGDRLRIAGRGFPRAGGGRGDLHVTLQVLPCPHLPTREALQEAVLRFDRAERELGRSVRITAEDGDRLSDAAAIERRKDLETGLAELGECERRALEAAAALVGTVHEKEAVASAAELRARLGAADRSAAAGLQRLGPETGADVESWIVVPLEAVLTGTTVEAGATERRTQVEVPPGVRDGHVLVIEGRGEPGRRGGAHGALRVHVRVSPDTRWTRLGDDLIAAERIGGAVAQTGGVQEVLTLEGTKTITLPPQSTGRVRVTGWGVPRLNGVGRGDMIWEIASHSEPQDGGDEAYAADAAGEATSDAGLRAEPVLKDAGRARRRTGTMAADLLGAALPVIGYTFPLVAIPLLIGISTAAERQGERERRRTSEEPAKEAGTLGCFGFAFLLTVGWAVVVGLVVGILALAEADRLWITSCAVTMVFLGAIVSSASRRGARGLVIAVVGLAILGGLLVWPGLHPAWLPTVGALP